VAVVIKVGVIGLGRIGHNAALGLEQKGLLEAVHDLRPEIAGTIRCGLKNASSPGDVARKCDVVVIAVFSADQVRDVLDGPGGVLAAARPGLAVVLVSTVPLGEFRTLRAMAAERDVELLDCGVTGGYLTAEGGWVVFLGGDDQSVEPVLPAVNAFARRIFRMGPPGAGMAAKLAKNLIFYVTCRAEHEGVLLARAAGVSVPNLIEAIEEARAGTPACLWARRGPPDSALAAEMSAREYSASVLDKDLEAALGLAGELGIRLPATELTRATGSAVAGLERDA
jgi:3-hydroxyisobutyrate dehydrogenase-like beta-hydroxyacid dehydrogenase